ncbi:MAG: glycine cleavage system protein GcvH [Phycisphaerae bacterium]|jgi:glycine cleavage system H protein|nr:glycine cleavage system protein GcvH [Phycisphaerae bacterium]
MPVPQDRKYLKTHEWFKPEGDLVVVGITDHAAQELTDITFVQMPKVGTKISAGQSFGEVESVKATSEIYSGIDGEVVEINEELSSNPGLINSDAFNAGWIIKVRPSDTSQLEKLLSPGDYENFI